MVWNVSLLGPRDDVDRGAVHIHFAVADPIEPGPGQGVLARFDAVRDFVREVGGAGGLGVPAQIPVRGRRAAAFNRMDDAPLGVFRRFLIFGDGYLAGAAPVGRSPDEGEGLRLSDLHGVLLQSPLEGIDARTLLAWEVGPIGRQRAIVERRFAVGDGGGEFDVCVGRRDQPDGRRE